MSKKSGSTNRTGGRAPIVVVDGDADYAIPVHADSNPRRRLWTQIDDTLKNLRPQTDSKTPAPPRTDTLVFPAFDAADLDESSAPPPRPPERIIGREQGWHSIHALLDALQQPPPAPDSAPSDTALQTSRGQNTVREPAPQILSNEEFAQAWNAADPEGQQHLLQSQAAAYQYLQDQVDPAVVEAHNDEWTGA